MLRDVPVRRGKPCRIVSRWAGASTAANDLLSLVLPGFGEDNAPSGGTFRRPGTRTSRRPVPNGTLASPGTGGREPRVGSARKRRLPGRAEEGGVRWDPGRLARLPRRYWPVTAALVLLAGAAWSAPHLRAWWHLRAARSDLARFHAGPAREHLRVCLHAWPASARTHLLASRAARLAGDFEDAEQHLRQAQRLEQLPADDVVFEWALLRATAGDLVEVDQFLESRLRKDPAEAPLIWEALGQGYLRTYRISDALACLDRWLQHQPDCVPALLLRGKVWLKARAPAKGLPDLQKAVAADPTHAATRWYLALSLMEARRWSEAVPHLEELRAWRPQDPEILVRLAACHHLLGRAEPARVLLDTVLAEHPAHGLALRTRGQVEMADGSPAEAEKWLRQALAVLPHDYQTFWALYRALLRQDKTAEANVCMLRATEEEDRATRLGDLLTHQMSGRPLDPALHCELGVLLLQIDQKEEGAGWLLSALRLDAGYRPAHAALADYYQARGDASRAADHRRQAQ
jgi:tetratricopeptide (TPR) repeat protein